MFSLAKEQKFKKKLNSQLITIYLIITLKKFFKENEKYKKRGKIWGRYLIIIFTFYIYTFKKILFWYL